MQSAQLVMQSIHAAPWRRWEKLQEESMSLEDMWGQAGRKGRVDRQGLWAAPGAGIWAPSGLPEPTATIYLGETGPPPPTLSPGLLHPIWILTLAEAPALSPYMS